MRPEPNCADKVGPLDLRMNDKHIPDVLSLYGLRCVAPPVRVSAGTLNENYLVQTQRGPKVLRRIRDDQPDANVCLEHETIIWMHQRALPVALPIAPTLPSDPTDAGLPTTCIRLRRRSEAESEPGRWALFDFIKGAIAPRSQLSRVQASALGDMHGRLQRALAKHPRSSTASFTMQWSTEQADRVLHQSHIAAEQANAPSVVLEGINLQRALLNTTDIRGPEHFAKLPCQWLHGDFHSGQVLLDERSTVTAVLDWELCQSGARVWELIRSIAFSGLLEQPALEDYLSAYCRHIDLSEEEVALGMDLWWQSRIVGGWVWWAGYVQGNLRVLDVVPDTIATLNSLAQPGWSAGINQRVIGLVTAART